MQRATSSSSCFSCLVIHRLFHTGQLNKKSLGMESSLGFSDCLIKLSSLVNKVGKSFTCQGYFLQTSHFRRRRVRGKCEKEEKIKLETEKGEEHREFRRLWESCFLMF